MRILLLLIRKTCCSCIYGLVSTHKFLKLPLLYLHVSWTHQRYRLFDLAELEKEPMRKKAQIWLSLSTSGFYIVVVTYASQYHEPRAFKKESISPKAGRLINQQIAWKWNATSNLSVVLYLFTFRILNSHPCTIFTYTWELVRFLRILLH